MRQQIKTCNREICTNSLEEMRSDAKFCSEKCRNSAKNKRYLSENSLMNSKRKNLLALDRILKHFFQHQMFIDRAFSRAYLRAYLFDFNMYIRISKEEDVSDQIFELYNFGYYYTDDDKQLVKIIKL